MEISRVSSNNKEFFVDAHCHLYEFSTVEIEKFGEFKILAVSDDLSSSIKTINLSRIYLNVIPCIGIHPWEINEESVKQLERLKQFLPKIKCLGEIGLDKRFVPKTYKLQLKIFQEFLENARNYNLLVNLHAAGAWREVYNLVKKYDVSRAIFHWYSGPLDLLREIVDSGYCITINPTVVINKKHMQALKQASIENILTESDGPYKYRGFDLRPELIKNTIKVIAQVKNINVEQVKKQILYNFNKLFK